MLVDIMCILFVNENHVSLNVLSPFTQTQMVEHFLTAQLELKVPDFKMDHFMEDLK